MSRKLAIPIRPKDLAGLIERTAQEIENSKCPHKYWIAECGPCVRDRLLRLAELAHHKGWCEAMEGKIR